MPLVRKGPAAGPAGGTEVAPGALDSPDPDTRWAAARSLAGDPAALEPLARALAGEPDPRVREAIFTSLARIGSPEAAAAVIPMLRSPDAAVRGGALDALHAMPAGAAAELPALLRNPDSDIRLLACELARSQLGPESAQLLAERLDEEPHPNVCAAIIDVLAETAGPEALPSLARCAERFAAEPFLVFAVKVARERIGASGGQASA